MKIFMDDLVIIRDEVAESYNEDRDLQAHSNDKAKSYNQIKIIPANFNEKKATFKPQTLTYFILLTFSLITILKSKI